MPDHGVVEPLHCLYNYGCYADFHVLTSTQEPPLGGTKIYITA